MLNTRFKSKNNGFTLMELLVSFGIVVLLTGIILLRYRVLDNRFSVVSAAHTLVQDMRKMQEKSISGEEIHGEIPAGYGIYFHKDNRAQYILYADTSALPEGAYDTGDIIIDTIDLKTGLSFNLGENISYIDINFAGPSPITKILVDGDEPNTKTIDLEVEEHSNLTQQVFINKAGLIYAQNKPEE